MPSVIPIVSFSDRDAPQAIGDALRDIGLVFLRVNPASTSDVYGGARTLFALPDEAQKQYIRPDVHYQRGLSPPFQETALACKPVGNRPAKPDAKVMWGLGEVIPRDHRLRQSYPDFYPDNIWPAEVPEFRASTEALYSNLLAIGKRVLRSLEVYIFDHVFRERYDPKFVPALTELAHPNAFVNMVTYGPHFMRVIHYPPVSVEQAKTVSWACKHTDINFITVLPAPSRSGLWVRCHDGDWISARVDEDAVLVQVGDMLQHHTGGFFRSAVHEVRIPEEGTTESRYSAALFVHPESDRLLNPHHKVGARFPPITAHDYLMKRLTAIGLSGQKS